MQVFLSYSRRDAAFVGRLADDLARHGIEPWLDTDDLPTDDDDRWRRSVVCGIRESAALVLVLSPDSVRSPAVERELTIAAEMGRRVIPVVHRPCALTDGLMFELAGVQRVDFVDQRYPESLDRLVGRIRAAGSAGSRTRRAGPDAARPAASDGPRNAGRSHPAGDDPTQPRSRVRRVALPGAAIAVVIALFGAVRLLDGVAAGASAGGSPVASAPAAVSTTPDGSDGAGLVPWERATAVLGRQDGSTAVVTATSVGLGCGRGSLLLADGQTIDLDRVAGIEFSSVDVLSATADVVVTLLDGRRIDGPLSTRNCPITGTTELGPLTIQLDEIASIDIRRDPAAPDD